MIFTVNNFTQMYSRFKAVDNMSFTVPSGTIMGLIGTNGAGKTTIIKAASGLLKPTKGEFSISEINIKSNRKEYLRSIGAVLEGNRNIYMRLSPEENIEYFARMRNLSRSEYLPRLNYLLDVFQLEEKRKVECNSLSRGMQQKVAICCSIIHEPKVVFLDEPTLGLDFESVKIMEQIIRNLVSEDRIIIVTSHDLDFISNLVNHIVVINRGEKILDGPISSLDSLKDKNYFEITIPYDFDIFEDSRIVEVSNEAEGKEIRFAFQSPYEISNIISKFEENLIPILNMKQSNYSLADLYMDLVKDNEDNKEVTQQ